jgi:CheY-like chemotaxis protein
MEGSSGSAIRVLLIEDNPMIAELRTEVFEDLGCEVKTAATADDALTALASSTRFDVLMTDVNLGHHQYDQSGLEVARRARELRPHLPIVGYTAVFSESEIPMDEHPEIAQWFIKGSLGLVDLRGAMEDVVRLGEEARAAREE